MEYVTYLDKVHGGWLGKCIGGAAGAPVEGIKELINIEHYQEVIRADLPNDDLDLQLLWLYVIQQKGWDITAKDLAEAWDKHCWYPFNEYGYFLKNYDRGIMPPYSGWFNNSLFAGSEGCPIRSEIWGMTSPGDPDGAAYYAGLDGSLDHAGEAVWVEQYYAAVEAMAFAETDIVKLLEAQLPYLQEHSRAYNCVTDVLTYWRETGRTWIDARANLMRKYAHFDFTDAVVNLGIVVLALLYGEKNLDETINIAFRCGFDTDCTCATAGAILGIIKGAGEIPEELKAFVSDEFVIGIDVPRDNSSILKLSEETCAVGLMPKQRIRRDFAMEVSYKKYPAIGAGDTCEFAIRVDNNTDEPYGGELQFAQIPDGFRISCLTKCHLILPRTSQTFECIAQSSAGAAVKNKNMFEASFGNIKTTIGIAGASEWSAVGPFFEALQKEDPQGLPSAHTEGCVLPTLECMVNNAVFLDEEYINEDDFNKSFAKEPSAVIHAYEDLIPIEETFTLRGQMCIYLKQNIYLPEDRDIWMVIGNNDGFAVWVNQKKVMIKDEIRLWTPYNNYNIVSCKKGLNEIVIKLLRRTEQLKFSMGLREYGNEHFHRTKWITDLSSSI